MPPSQQVDCVRPESGGLSRNMRTTQPAVPWDNGATRTAAIPDPSGEMFSKQGMSPKGGTKKEDEAQRISPGPHTENGKQKI